MVSRRERDNTSFMICRRQDLWITYEVATLTFYHPSYGSGKLVGNNYSNPCYITVTEFLK